MKLCPTKLGRNVLLVLNLKDRDGCKVDMVENSPWYGEILFLMVRAKRAVVDTELEL